MHLFGRCAMSIVVAPVIAYCSHVMAQEPGTAVPVEVTILAINDLHGNLSPPPGGVTILDPNDRTRRTAVAAGGVEHIATLVRQIRAERKHVVFVAAGDLIGSSPVASSLFQDEPTIQSLSLMGLDFSAVGAGEFSNGRREFFRKLSGGCYSGEGCQGPDPFVGAGFRYLSANALDKATGKPILPAYTIREFDGVPVAFVGLSASATAQVTPPTIGLDFQDEAEAVNALVPQLKAKGVEEIVVLIHEGGIPSGGHNECPGLAGTIVDIVKRFDGAARLVISGRTHRAYVCDIDGHLVTSADRFGTMVTRIDVTLDRQTRRIATSSAKNIIVRPESFAKDPAQTELTGFYSALAQQKADRIDGTGFITKSLTRAQNQNGESVLGDILADAQLAVTSSDESGGAVIAFASFGGIRSDILKVRGGAVAWRDMLAAQPFGNALVTLTLTGAQIKLILEQQWLNQPRPRILQVSRGFTYTWDDRRAQGDFVPADQIFLNGKVIESDAPYRVTVSQFIADGGDGFTEAKKGTARRIGSSDVEALEAYFKVNTFIDPPPLGRIRRVH